MKQFDWILALRLVRCQRSMEQFHWLIVLGLVRCGLLMVQFDWLIASGTEKDWRRLIAAAPACAPLT